MNASSYAGQKAGAGADIGEATASVDRVFELIDVPSPIDALEDDKGYCDWIHTLCLFANTHYYLPRFSYMAGIRGDETEEDMLKACLSALLYTVLNYTLTVLTILMNSDLYGWGAAVASCTAFLVAARILWVRVDDLLYQTFSKSPVETLPEKVKGLPGVGRYRIQKGELSC